MQGCYRFLRHALIAMSYGSSAFASEIYDISKGPLTLIITNEQGPVNITTSEARGITVLGEKGGSSFVRFTDGRYFLRFVSDSTKKQPFNVVIPKDVLNLSVFASETIDFGGELTSEKANILLTSERNVIVSSMIKADNKIFAPQIGNFFRPQALAIEARQDVVLQRIGPAQAVVNGRNVIARALQGSFLVRASEAVDIKEENILGVAKLESPYVLTLDAKNDSSFPLKVEVLSAERRKGLIQSAPIPAFCMRNDMYPEFVR